MRLIETIAKDPLFEIILRIFLIYCAATFTISIMELINVNLLDSSGYPWGWEAGGLKYKSSQNYSLLYIINFLLSGSVLLTFIVCKPQTLPRILSSLIFLALSVSYYIF